MNGTESEKDASEREKEIGKEKEEEGEGERGGEGDRNMTFGNLDGIRNEIVHELKISEPVVIEPYGYTTAKCTCRKRNGMYIIRISPFYESAPESVIKSLVGSVLARASKRPDTAYTVIYRNYMKQNSTRNKLVGYRSTYARKVLRGEVGRIHDLRTSFHRINREYFENRISGITLTWGRSSRRTLGHYDEAKRTIVVSSILDRASIPAYLVDYIIYHELLHHEIPTFYRNGRRVMHSPEFKRREREYKRYSDAVKKMRKLR